MGPRRCQRASTRPGVPTTPPAARRFLLRRLVGGMARWEPIRDPKPGYSLVVACHHRFPELLIASLRLLVKQDLTHLDRLYVAVNSVRHDRLAAAEIRMRREFPKPPPVPLPEPGAIPSPQAHRLGLGRLLALLLQGPRRGDDAPRDAPRYGRDAAAAGHHRGAIRGHPGAGRSVSGIRVVQEQRLRPRRSTRLHRRADARCGVPEDRFRPSICSIILLSTTVGPSISIR